jgi:hypothetical protein
LLDAAVDPGVTVRPPRVGTNYRAFLDPSGGISDSFTLAIAHAEGNRAVLDLLHERRAPFNPSEAVEQIAAVLRNYGLAQATGDRYAAAWVTEAFENAASNTSNPTATAVAFTSIRCHCLPPAALA